MIKGIMHQEDITLINQSESPEICKTITNRTKGRNMAKHYFIVGDLNTLLSDMDRSSKQIVNKEITSLNGALDKLDITDIYRAFHPKQLLL